MALDLSTLTPDQQLAAIYIGYYDRAADPFGNAFWVNALANPSLGLADIADDFSTQAETLIAYPFLGDPTPEEANAFITEVYLNLFNREPDAEGLAFWSAELLAAIAGDEGALSVGEIILAIIEGAQDVEGGTQDRTTILNKIEVATSWTAAADAAGLNEENSYGDDAAAQASAKSIIEGVTDDESTVTSAKSTIDDFFDDEPSVPGNTIFLTSATDVVNGDTSTGDTKASENDDEFLGYLAQNPFVGGVSNTLSSAERLDGEAGNDRLYAELTNEFVGTNLQDATDIQPRLTSIEEIDIEARDTGFGGSFFYEGPFGGFSAPIIVDGKHITDHEELSSYYSDGDLVFENVTTLTEGGSARNTDAITIGMDHTDNFNSDCDASDLTVLFDNDYLLSGQQNASDIVYFLLDEDAERTGNPNRLDNIDVNGIIFDIINADGTTTQVRIADNAANIAGTHEQFVNELQDEFQAKIDDGTLPEGSRLFLDPTRTDTTFDDDGNESAPIPGIVVESGDGTELKATGFARIEEEIGEYDVYGRFISSGQSTQDDPITVNIDLHKAGRGGEGGDLIIGGKAQNTPDGIADGIEVFKINVIGAGNDGDALTKPSNLGTITSTGNELREVYISTDPKDAAGDSYASLTIRNGFDQYTGCDCSDFELRNGPVGPYGRSYSEYGHGNMESGDLELINADAFLGDLTLGDTDANNNSGRITNADTITAQGGGNVELGLYLDGNETDQAYHVTTGSGNDIVDMRVDGDSLDYAGSSLNIYTAGGDDLVIVDMSDLNHSRNEDYGNERLNQIILDNVEISTGDGDDTIHSTIGSAGNLNIKAGDGDDFINTSGGREERNKKFKDGSDDYFDGDYCGPEMDIQQDLACWAFNFDDERDYDYGPDFDLAGVPTSLAYVGGATVTVTLSGAGVDGDLRAGGGIMAEEAVNPAGVDGAVKHVNGYEASAVIGTLNNGNTHWGDQTDVIDAIFEAIESDPILSKLLTIEMTENNTFVITSATGGRFEEEDLKIEISQRDHGSDESDWNGVESEARSVFSDSGIVIDGLDDANGAGTGPSSVPDLRTTFGSSSDHYTDSAYDWFTGLSASRDADLENGSYQFKDGAGSRGETDNVITPGAGDDLVVLSTQDGFSDGSSGFDTERQIIADFNEGGELPGVDWFTPIAGNTLQNAASNETLVFADMFGNDTIMNFTTGDPRLSTGIAIENDATIKNVNIGDDAAAEVPATTIPEIFVLELSDPETGETGDLAFGDFGPFAVDDTMSASDIADAIVAASPITISGTAYTVTSDGGTVTFTEEADPASGAVADVTIADFLDVAGVVVGMVITQQGATTDPGSPEVTATPTTFEICFGNADQDAVYTFDGETIPVVEGQTGTSIAQAVEALGIFDNWTVTGRAGDTVFFEANTPGAIEAPENSDIAGANIEVITDEVEHYNSGLDFLDYSAYLDSQFDSSSGPGPDGNDSNVRIPVTLDYNEDNDLGGSGDGSSNAKVEANEVAVVRMANDSTDGESWSALSASHVEALFNNDGTFTGFGDDSSYGNLDAADFSAETYTKTGDNPALIGDGKAIFKVENPGNLGEYKVFELTWSGDNSSESGATVTAKEIGTQDYGTSLTGLDDINLVGSETYGDLIYNGFDHFFPFEV